VLHVVSSALNRQPLHHRHLAKRAVWANRQAKEGGGEEAPQNRSGSQYGKKLSKSFLKPYRVGKFVSAISSKRQVEQSIPAIMVESDQGE